MEIISIILGGLLLIGFLVLPKEDDHEITDPKFKIMLRGARVIRRTLVPLLAVALLGSGIYYFLKKKEERDTRITLEKILKIVNSPQAEKETQILKLGFEPTDRDENGGIFVRDSNTNFFENFNNGTVRYITKDKSSYIRVREAVVSEGFEPDGDVTNNQGDIFTSYKKPPIFVSMGLFSKSQQYVAVFRDSTKFIYQPPVITPEELVGKWGRIHYLRNGTYTFKVDFTFSFNESTYGTITGRYRIEDRELILNYNEKNWQYTIKHPFSSKTESIVIKSKTATEINGYLKGEGDDILFVKQ